MKKARIVFRVEGGPVTGMGHIVRCVRLAYAINERIPTETAFLTETPEYFVGLIDSNSNDRYPISLRGKEPKIFYRFLRYFEPHVVITDMKVIQESDQYVREVEKIPLHVNIGENYFNRFNFGMVIFPSILPVKPKCGCETKAKYFTGADYLLIDPRLRDLAQPKFGRTKPINVLVTMGGSDPMKHTLSVISAIRESQIDETLARFNVVVGHANPMRDEIIREADGLNCVAISDPRPDLYELISETDLAITSGGTTIYEMISAGRPSWVIPQIEFEMEVAKILRSKNTILGVGLAGVKNSFLAKLDEFRCNTESLYETIQYGRKFIDGKGLNRVADKISSQLSVITSS